MKEDGELPGRVKLRSSQYLNNLVEQDHRRVKQRILPMLGFKRFDNAVVTISGIELAEKFKKGQFKTGKLGGCDADGTRRCLKTENLQAAASEHIQGFRRICCFLFLPGVLSLPSVAPARVEDPAVVSQGRREGDSEKRKHAVEKRGSWFGHVDSVARPEWSGCCDHTLSQRLHYSCLISRSVKHPNRGDYTVVREVL
jgi:hypothetical protein